MTRAIAVIDAPVTITAPAQVLPGSEISVGWTGPDAPYDNIQIAEAGSDSYLSYAYVTGGNPLVMTAPDAPGRYELRYKLTDTEVIATRAFEVLPAGSVLPADAVPALVSVTIRAETGEATDPISWSAAPLHPAADAPEAVAMPEAFAGPWLAELSPGLWQVEGLADSGLSFAAEITVTDAAGQVFDIPVGFESEGMGEDALPMASGTPVSDPATGLRVTLPQGWTLAEAFLGKTAAGVTAAAPTATFAGPEGRLILLNPLQWLDSNGTCYDSPLGPLCVFGAEDAGTAPVVNLILSSLSLAAAAPDLGGTPFTPQGDDPMSTLVPGWSAK